MTIRRLDEGTINRIAAGEVVERPASALKELVENAIDAGAKRIDVTLENGGKSLIRVEDDGCGMSPADLALSLERHATSKLPNGDAGDNLFRITSLGFRGEALPAIGAVSKMTITTRTADAAEASILTVAGGVAGDMRPAAGTGGTRIETHITIRNPEGDAIAECTTKAGRHDLNDMPAETLSLKFRFKTCGPP